MLLTVRKMFQKLLLSQIRGKVDIERIIKKEMCIESAQMILDKFEDSIKEPSNQEENPNLKKLEMQLFIFNFEQIEKVISLIKTKVKECKENEDFYNNLRNLLIKE